MTELSPGENGLVRLDGDLTVDEVPGIYRYSLTWKHNSLPAGIDLSKIGQSDSSAVALLLEWAEWAENAGQKIEFRNPTDSMRTIAGLSDVEALLGWKEES